MTQHQPSRKALHAIASLEAFKGVLALAALIGLLDLLHEDARALAMAWIGRFGLNPEGHYSSIVLHYAELLPNTDVTLLIQLGMAYALIRFVEAYGLWFDKVWGEYLGALSGAIYVPFELRHLIETPDWISAFVLLFNCLIVVYLARVLMRKRSSNRNQHQS